MADAAARARSKEERRPFMTKGAAYSAVVLLITEIGLLVSGLFLINTNNHKWCKTLITIDTASAHTTPHPAPGSYGYQLEHDFHDLRRALGCGG